MSTSPAFLEGKFEVLAKIREGGMGAIYKVRHRLLNELRIIKVMRPEVAQSADQRKRFLREAQTATRLRHPNIVAFHDFFVDEEDTAYMVMEYIEGINLRDTLRACGEFPVFLGLDISRQSLDALGYLHRRSIVHRDISPDNIMMTRDEDGSMRAKLIDLGIAKIAHPSVELTKADEFIGKLRYSSPEQLMKTASSKEIDARSDLFSFGIVIYELLTGVCPYGGDSIHEIVTNRLQRPPLSFEESDPKGRLSPAVREAILKALRSAPEERYQTASEFEKTLGRLSVEIGSKSRELVDQYVKKAMIRVAEVVRSQEGAAVDLFKVHSPEPGSSGRSAAPEDLKFRRTIARWSEATPSLPASIGDVLPAAQKTSDRSTAPQEKTRDLAAVGAPTAALGPATPPPAVPYESREQPGKRPQLFRYAAVAVSAALLVVIGVWIAGRQRGGETMGRDFRTTPDVSRNRPEEQPSTGIASPVATRPAALPESREETTERRVEIAAPQEKPVTATDLAVRKEPTLRPPIEDVAAAPPAPRAGQARSTPKPAAARPKPTPAPRIAQLRPSKVPRPAEKETVSSPVERRALERGETDAVAGPSALAPATKSQYCLKTERTTYGQGVVREVPPGFGGTGNRAPRPDSALMEIKVSLDTARPVDDQQFFVIVRFENGGPSRVEIKSLEQMSSRGEMRQVPGSAVPVTVAAGGIRELYRFPLKLSGGEAYNKSFAVTDARGDIWSTTFRVVSCPD